jgi:hypothetical protein
MTKQSQTEKDQIIAYLNRTIQDQKNFIEDLKKWNESWIEQSKQNRELAAT